MLIISLFCNKNCFFLCRTHVSLEIYKSTFGATLEVKTTHGKKSIRLADVLYFESDGSYVKTVTEKETYTERCTLNEIEDKLGKRIIRIHRSFLINKDKIQEYNSKEVYIEGRAIPISRSYRKNLK